MHCRQLLQRRYFGSKRLKETEYAKAHTSKPKTNANQMSTKEIPLGTDSLFQECLDRIYRKRFELDERKFGQSAVIDDLDQKEARIVATIFRRVNPMQEFPPKKMDSSGRPLPFVNDSRHLYWDPFQKVDELKRQIALDFHEYTKIASYAEIMKERNRIKKLLQEDQTEYSHVEAPEPDQIKHEKFWDPNPNIRRVLANNRRPFDWKDLHALFHFVADNGQILPRRLTLATRCQQRQIFRAIRIARDMAVFPFDWKPRIRDRIPIMDPLQYLADELTHLYINQGDLRARAMLTVLAKRDAKINLHRLLKYEAHKSSGSDASSTDNNVTYM